MGFFSRKEVSKNRKAQVCQKCGGLFILETMKKVYTGYLGENKIYFCKEHTPEYDKIEDIPVWNEKTKNNEE